MESHQIHPVTQHSDVPTHSCTPYVYWCDCAMSDRENTEQLLKRTLHNCLLPLCADMLQYHDKVLFAFTYSTHVVAIATMYTYFVNTAMLSHAYIGFIHHTCTCTCICPWSVQDKIFPAGSIMYMYTRHSVKI